MERVTDLELTYNSVKSINFGNSIKNQDFSILTNHSRKKIFRKLIFNSDLTPNFMRNSSWTSIF